MFVPVAFLYWLLFWAQRLLMSFVVLNLFRQSIVVDTSNNLVSQACYTSEYPVSSHDGTVGEATPHPILLQPYSIWFKCLHSGSVVQPITWMILYPLLRTNAHVCLLTLCFHTSLRFYQCLLTQSNSTIQSPGYTESILAVGTENLTNRLWQFNNSGEQNDLSLSRCAW